MQGLSPIIRIAQAAADSGRRPASQSPVTRALPFLAVLALGAGLALLVTAGGTPPPVSATQVVVELTAPPLARAHGPAAVPAQAEV